MTLHILTKDAAHDVYRCRHCTGEWTSVMRASETPCVPDGHGKDVHVERSEPER